MKKKYISIFFIPKQPEESVSAWSFPIDDTSMEDPCVGQPPLFVPPAPHPKDDASSGTPALNFSSLGASVPESLDKNRGASLASSRFFRLFRYIGLLALASCAIQQLNSKMEETNVLMEQNKAAIEENTRQIIHSTSAMERAQWILPLILIVALALYFIVRKYTKTT